MTEDLPDEVEELKREPDGTPETTPAVASPVASEHSNRGLWPLLAAIAVAGLFWWFDLPKRRIRRFVKGKPVEAADPTTLRDDWGDKMIEVMETAEEVIVSKTAHIAEEVVISKTGTDRVETVRDTVRRQQIEVEKIPASEKAKKA